MSRLLGGSPVCAEHHRVPALQSWLGQGPALCADTKVEVGQRAVRSEFAEQDSSEQAADGDQPDLGWKDSVSEKQSPRIRPLRVKTAGVTVALKSFNRFFKLKPSSFVNARRCSGVYHFSCLGSNVEK